MNCHATLACWHCVFCALGSESTSLPSRAIWPRHLGWWAISRKICNNTKKTTQTYAWIHEYKYFHELIHPLQRLHKIVPRSWKLRTGMECLFSNRFNSDSVQKLGPCSFLRWRSFHPQQHVATTRPHEKKRPQSKSQCETSTGQSAACELAKIKLKSSETSQREFFPRTSVQGSQAGVIAVRSWRNTVRRWRKVCG